jgi:tetratricopeptide (TPR) repeat protein
MLMDHPTVEDFDGFLRSASRPGNAARNARVLRHLLADCSPCRHQLLHMGWGERRLERLFRFPVDREEQGVAETASPYDYSRAFASAEQALDHYFAEGQSAESTPEELLAELSPLSQEEQTRWVMTYSRFSNPQLIRKLVEMSHEVRYENAARMLHLADLARLAAEACTVAIAGSAPKLADLRAQGWRHYANALRVSGRLHEAEEAFATALRLCQEGTGDPPLRAALLERMASLRIFQRRFDQAIALANEAGLIYHDLGETRSVASTMVQKAIAQIYSGEVDAAVRTLNRAIPLIDHEGDPHLLLAACHNLIRCYIDMGQPEQALSIYFEARGLYKDFQDPLIALRAGWQEGQLLRDLGHLRAAEAALLRSRQGFMEKGLFYETALVGLDLSAVYLRLGETEKLREAVSEMVPVFTSLGVDREALAALLQLKQATQQSRQAFELIRFLGTRLEQLPHGQTLK